VKLRQVFQDKWSAEVAPCDGADDLLKVEHSLWVQQQVFGSPYGPLIPHVKAADAAGAVGGGLRK
jgi:hypothetical protein